ncbi:NAD-dependent epimerase/dehydratase family protein, partial [Dehalococcoidia bacterium]|nr:NAD-dependent epimerase/dehydratase family protein [Dehalococcoidia bacterium]
MSDVNETFWAGKKTLVGGGFGFLGSYMVAQLIEAKAIVTVADNLNNAYARDLSQDNVEFIQGDLSNSDLCDRLMEKKDIVINLAAKAYGMEYSRSHNGEMLVSNLLCTLVPLESARRQGVERFVIMSSSCVYPDEAPVPTPELPVFTGNPESVNEGYGWAKRIQELAGTYYAQDYGMKVAVVRPFNP